VWGNADLKVSKARGICKLVGVHYDRSSMLQQPTKYPPLDPSLQAFINWIVMNDNQA
jgi:hypothetical protein